MKVKLAIMYGGPGGEHEVSVKSAKNILENIDKNKYEVLEIFISKKTKIISSKILKILKNGNFLVWPIFHGEFGEGGYVQEVLEKNKIKFIGSISKVSKLAIDKLKTQKVLEKNGILCPKSLVVSDYKDFRKLKISQKLNLPIILKPLSSGSSVGLKKAHHHDHVHGHVKDILKNHGDVLVQEFLEGREFTCGVLNIGKKVLALPITEIVLTKTEMFDYDAKYSSGGCLEVTPAKIDDKLTRKIQDISKKFTI